MTPLSSVHLRARACSRAADVPCPCVLVPSLLHVRCSRQTVPFALLDSPRARRPLHKRKRTCTCFDSRLSRAFSRCAGTTHPRCQAGLKRARGRAERSIVLRRLPIRQPRRVVPCARPVCPSCDAVKDAMTDAQWTAVAQDRRPPACCGAADRSLYLSML